MTSQRVQSGNREGTDLLAGFSTELVEDRQVRQLFSVSPCLRGGFSRFMDTSIAGKEKPIRRGMDCSEML